MCFCMNEIPANWLNSTEPIPVRLGLTTRETADIDAIIWS
jgi:hypothetical protein